MSNVSKASDHVKPCKIAQSELHNSRDMDYINSLNPSKLYIRTDLMHLNETYVAPGMEGASLRQLYDDIKAMVKEKTGRAMQEKDVEFTDKRGKKRVRQGCSPIRESVVNIKPDTTMDDLLRYTQKVYERWGISAVQIHIHKDEGHYEKPGDAASWTPNLHAHIIWDWMDHSTGKSFKLNKDDMSEMQDMVAETLAMERGKKKSETGAEHLERNDYILQKQKEKEQRLREETEKALEQKMAAETQAAAAEAEKAKAEQQTAAAREETAKAEKETKAAVENLTKIQETAKDQQGKLLLLSEQINDMQQRSETLDSDIEAKEERVGKLDNQLEELENELNNLSSKEPWQQNIFHSLTYLLYKTNPTMQSCIKAIQDFAFSGTGCRGGKHGDIFWDEESSTIKSFMEYYNKATKVPFVHVGKYLVWLADQISHFNKLEKRRASREVNDVAEGRYDWRIQRSQGRGGGRKR